MAALGKAIDKQLLKGLSPLGKLTHDKIDDIVSKSRVENLPAGRLVFRQGEDDGQTIYLLSGQIELSSTGSSRKQLIKAKSIEAKFPLADKVPRPATARTKTAVSLLYIDSSLLEILLDDNPSGEYEVTEISVADRSTEWMMRFLQSRAFLKLPTENIQHVLLKMEEVPAHKGDVIIRQDDEGDYYYIIKHGACAVSRQPAPKAEAIRLARLTEGDGFGEEALITHGRRNATVTMLEDGTLMRLTKADFLTLLVAPLSRYVHLNSLKGSLYNAAVILDVRTHDEFKRGSLDKARHIPLSMIRIRMPTLDTTKQYLIYADNKDDAKAAAFLLAQHGMDCLIIEGQVRQNLPMLQPALEPDGPPQPAGSAPAMHPEPATDAPMDIPSQSSARQATPITETAAMPTGQAADKPAPAPDSHPLPKTESLQTQARQDAEHILAQAETIRQTAIHEASRLRDKIEKEETLRLRSELEDTRRRAESAFRKSEQLAEQIRQQAEEESSQIRQEALHEAERLRQEIAQLREQESQVKRQLESELLNVRQQAAEQARLAAAQEAEAIRLAAEQATAQAREMALREAEETRASALREAEETRALAEKAAAAAQAAADRLTHEALEIEQEAAQFRRRAQQEAEVIRQAALQEAKRIREHAMLEVEKMKEASTSKTDSFIRHDNVFSLDESPAPAATAAGAADAQASAALHMAREIKAGMIELDRQRSRNTPEPMAHPATQTVVIKKLKGKTILESAEDIFVFKEPGYQEAVSATPPLEAANQAPTDAIPDTAMQNPVLTQPPAPAVANIIPHPSPLKQAQASTSSVSQGPPQKKEHNKRLLAIGASLVFIAILSAVVYSIHMGIDFTELGARDNPELRNTRQTSTNDPRHQHPDKKTNLQATR